MRRFLAALAALAFALFAPARADAPRPSAPQNPFEGALVELEGRAKQAATPREELETLSLLAALSMVHILESQGRYEPFRPGPRLRSNKSRMSKRFGVSGTTSPFRASTRLRGSSSNSSKR